ncbi:MAG: hypothetical protein HYX24_05740 [Candidatus Aenigmarchaeota archaeon]|nr:hypothetical protein [Candidatus Aenigmarchaeota archaeon]
MVNELKVHTGQWPSDERQLDSLRRVTSEIVDIGFYRRNPDTMVAERVPYNADSIRRSISHLGATLRDPTTREEATIYVSGLENVEELLGDLGVSPVEPFPAVGRQVNAYRDSLTLYGVWVPRQV